MHLSQSKQEPSRNALEGKTREHTCAEHMKIYGIIKKSYLYNILSVLCRVLEDRAAVLQVLFIKAQRLVVHLSEALVPQLGFLQVGQEVGVDRATLDEAHAAGHRTKS